MDAIKRALAIYGRTGSLDPGIMYPTDIGHGYFAGGLGPATTRYALVQIDPVVGKPYTAFPLLAGP